MKLSFLSLLILFTHPLLAQTFAIGSIDVYGNRKVQTDTVLSHLTIRVGDSISHESFQPEQIAARLKQIPGVKYAMLNPVCCDTAGRLMLYVGVGESDEVILPYRDAPTMDLRLPPAFTDATARLSKKLEEGILKGQAAEVDSPGYALSNYGPAREEQQRFVRFTEQRLPLLIDVLHQSKYPDQRAAAAEIIPYSDKKPLVVQALLYAISDPDEDVRNNAVRALGILAGYGRLHAAERNGAAHAAGDGRTHAASNGADRSGRYGRMHAAVNDGAVRSAGDGRTQAASNGAVRSADRGRTHPSSRIDIPADPFIRMMQSIVWTDRNKGASVLIQLTAGRDSALLHAIRQRALPSIVEMAKWKDRSHAFFAFVILGRIAGKDEEWIFEHNHSSDWPTAVEDMISLIRSSGS